MSAALKSIGIGSVVGAALGWIAFSVLPSEFPNQWAMLVFGALAGTIVGFLVHLAAPASDTRRLPEDLLFVYMVLSLGATGFKTQDWQGLVIGGWFVLSFIIILAVGIAYVRRMSKATDLGIDPTDMTVVMRRGVGELAKEVKRQVNALLKKGNKLEAAARVVAASLSLGTNAVIELYHR